MDGTLVYLSTYKRRREAANRSEQGPSPTPRPSLSPEFEERLHRLRERLARIDVLMWHIMEKDR